MIETEPSFNDTIERLWRIAIRRRWWILGSASVTALAAVLAVYILPNRYSSEATLLVVEQQVPERYVTPTTTTDVSSALQAMAQDVLSRTRLLGIIDEFGLYAKEKTRLAPEQLIVLMRRNIGIEPLPAKPGQRNVNAFKIFFTADTPYLAQQVASRLTSLFITENLRTREDQAINTTNFLNEQLQSARERLAEQEQRVRDFKMRYLGELPEQQQGNLAILTGLQTQLQNTSASLSRAQQQRVYLESLLSGYRDLASRGAALPGDSGARHALTPLELAQTDLARLQSERTRLLSSYTPQHPDVVKVNAEIARTETLVEHLKASQALVSEKAEAQHTPVNAADTHGESTVAQVKSQLQANGLEIENLLKDQKQLKAAISQYQDRLNQTPVREQQLAALLRDYELLKKDYADLLSKKQQAQLATSLEKQQAGQQFRLVDAPSLPTVPTSPKRVKISIAGLAAGVFLGLALAFFADGRDRSYHTEHDVRQRFPAPLVVGIPLLLTRSEQRACAWKRALEWVAGSALVLTVMIAEVYIYRQG